MSTPIDVRKRMAAAAARNTHRNNFPTQQNRNYRASSSAYDLPRSSNNIQRNIGASSVEPVTSYYNQPGGTQEEYYLDQNYSNFDSNSSPQQLTIQCKYIKISVNNLLTFHGRTDFLSTFYPCNFVICGHTYYSVEGYYEAVKIYCNVGVEAAQELSCIKSAAEAKKVARDLIRRHRVPQHQIREWKETQGLGALYNAVTAKFTQNRSLCKKLKETGDKLLVHLYEKDDVFASGCNLADLKAWASNLDGETLKIPLFQKSENLANNVTHTGKGKNLLGYILMRVRAELDAHDTSVDVFSKLSVN